MAKVYCDNLECRLNRDGNCWTTAVSIVGGKCNVRPDMKVNASWEDKKEYGDPKEDSLV